MRRGEQRELAAAFRALHRNGEIIVLPNAFDVASARIIAAHRPVALGTSSAAIAWAAGYPDGEHIPREEALAATERIVRAVDLGVTADVEAGYGDSPKDAAATADALLEIGAIGLNLQDTGHPRGAHAALLLKPEQAARKIAAVREVARRRKTELVINARTDVFLICVGGDDEEEQVQEAAERGNLYLAAGADCVFVPGPVSPRTIGALVTRIDGPVNIYALPGVPGVRELGELGVARLSVGCGPYQACLALVDEATRELLDAGSYDSFVSRHLAYPVVQELLG